MHYSAKKVMSDRLYSFVGFWQCVRYILVQLESLPFAVQMKSYCFHQKSGSIWQTDHMFDCWLLLLSPTGPNHPDHCWDHHRRTDLSELLGPISGSEFINSIIPKSLTFLRTWFNRRQAHFKVIKHNSKWASYFDTSTSLHYC